MTAPLAPTDESAVSEVLRNAFETKTTLRISGGGTRTAPGLLPEAQTEVTLNGHSGIVLYEPGSMNMVVKSGTPLSVVNEALETENQHFAFEPIDHRHMLGTAGDPTVGGVVAGNVSGPRRLLAGACRDHLLGVRLVDGRGQVVKNGGRVMKNVTGLDLVKLMCGAFGTLGIITELSFKTLPMAACAHTLAFPGLSIAQATRLFCDSLRKPYEVSGAAFVDGVAYLRTEGLAVQVTNRLAGMSAQFSGFEQETLVGDSSAELWRNIANVTHFTDRGADLWRLSVKPTDAAAITQRLQDQFSARVSLDWGGGLIWAEIPTDAEMAPVRDVLSGFAGHARLMRGSKGAAPVFQPEPAGIAKISAGIRARFDPAGILNPGLMNNLQEAAT